MTVKGEDSDEPACGVSRLRRQCADCLRGPNLVKTLVVLVCLLIVVYQVVACVQKLTNIPVTTHTHFDFNKSITYPSVTFCREPPYKNHKLKEHGLSAHPRYTSTWRQFNFSHISLDKLWEEITYTSEDFFIQYGLDSLRDNVEVTATLGFVRGRCYTLRARRPSRAGKAHGYSVTLQHLQQDINSSVGDTPPGYHVYVHYNNEPYTEVEVYNGGLVDYLYVNTGETLDVKLTVDEYVMMNDNRKPCSNEPGYSANSCTEACVWQVVAQQANCSGPWMDVPLARCNSYNGMRSLITAYMQTYAEPACKECMRGCRSLLYSAYVADRQKFYTWDSRAKVWANTFSDANLQTQLFIHFNHMVVSVFEEKHNYDWNVFVSELGGSVGFLLGLSVIGLISILGDAWSNLLRPLLCSPTPVAKFSPHTTPASEATPRKRRPDVD